MTPQLSAQRKSKYLSLYDKVRDASRAALEDYPEPDFDSPSAEHFRQNFPTQGDVFLLIANHPLDARRPVRRHPPQPRQAGPHLTRTNRTNTGPPTISPLIVCQADIAAG
ncbi:MAG: hypothetical protein R3C02_01825 [Planctomycetaceae bacterium]